MNKYLTSLVAVAAVTSMGVTSIPAEAAETNLEHVKSVITEAIDGLQSIGNSTSSDDIKGLYDEQIADTNLDTDVTLQTTAGGVKIDIDIIGTTEAAATIVGATSAGTIVSTPGAVTLDTLTFYKELTTPAAVSVEDQVNNVINSLSLNNNSTAYAIEKAVRVTLNNYEVTVHGFTLTPAVGGTKGSATGTIVIPNYDDGTIIKVPFNLSVSQGTDVNDGDFYEPTELQEALYTIEEALANLSVSNSTTIDDIQKCANSALTNKNMTVDIKHFYLESATDTTMGNIGYQINITDTVKNASTSEDNGNDIDTTATAKLRSSVKTYLASLVPSNSTNEDNILVGVTKAVNDSTVKVNIANFYLRKANGIKSAAWNGSGFCDFNVELEDLNNNYLNIDYVSDDFTSTSGASGSTGTSGSTGSSSSSHHSSGGSSSSSSTSSTSTATTGTTNASTGTVSDSTTPVSLANMSKEAVKAVEAKVISNIGAITGAVAGQAKEVVAADGTKVSVTAISKNGKNVGAVITAETPSAKAIIPIDKDSAPVAAVYKFVPLLGKYIQVQDAVITADAITLPVQANATYVASPVVMATTDTISQGWVQSGSNWYMVNTTGDALTGWQKDSTGWTYMSPSTGAMQTGWAQAGSTWYYLKNNGYMATGWVKDGTKWYYCNTDGSMAANTTVDGYEVDASGAWIE